jgi:hypothetical protein
MPRGYLKRDNPMIRRSDNSGLDDTTTDVAERSLEETVNPTIHRFANTGLDNTATDAAETHVVDRCFAKETKEYIR